MGGAASAKRDIVHKKSGAPRVIAWTGWPVWFWTSHVKGQPTERATELLPVAVGVGAPPTMCVCKPPTHRSRKSVCVDVDAALDAGRTDNLTVDPPRNPLKSRTVTPMDRAVPNPLLFGTQATLPRTRVGVGCAGV